MIHFITQFARREDGAVTVDWVVLTALVVGLAVAAFAGVNGGVTGLALNIQAYLLGVAAGG